MIVLECPLRLCGILLEDVLATSFDQAVALRFMVLVNSRLQQRLIMTRHLDVGRNQAVVCFCVHVKSQFLYHIASNFAFVLAANTCCYPLWIFTRGLILGGKSLLELAFVGHRSKLLDEACRRVNNCPGRPLPLFWGNGRLFSLHPALDLLFFLGDSLKLLQDIELVDLRQNDPLSAQHCLGHSVVVSVYH